MIMRLCDHTYHSICQSAMTKTLLSNRKWFSDKSPFHSLLDYGPTTPITFGWFRLSCFVIDKVECQCNSKEERILLFWNEIAGYRICDNASLFLLWEYSLSAIVSSSFFLPGIFRNNFYSPETASDFRNMQSVFFPKHPRYQVQDSKYFIKPHDTNYNYLPLWRIVKK